MLFRSKNNQFNILTEKDLHYKVVDFIRQHWKDANIIAGLGELQDTSEKRIDSFRKGYMKGQPDLILLNRTEDDIGLVLELKTPLGCGRTSPEQAKWLKRLEIQGFKVMVCDNYDEILMSLVRYMDKAQEYILARSNPSSDD